jgi:hypothetical protein
MGITPIRLFELSKRLSGMLRELQEAGLQIEIGDDFAKYRAYRSQQPDRGPIYAMFDVASSYIDFSNGFWICGFNASGELVHTQAVRLLDLSGISLATHLDIHRRKYITPDTTPDPDLTSYSGPEALQTITGKVCYQGDFWLRAQGLGGPRSQGVTSILSRVLLEIMVETWNPSFVFALVPKKLAAKGAHLRYGYSHCEPGHWLGPDQQVTEEDYLIWMGANDMDNLLSRTPQSLRSAVGAAAVQPTTTSIDVKGHLQARANV